MAEFPTVQGFKGICSDKVSALLAQTGFQPFVFSSNLISYAMITLSALKNLENLIYISSHASELKFH